MTESPLPRMSDIGLIDPITEPFQDLYLNSGKYE